MALSATPLIYPLLSADATVGLSVQSNSSMIVVKYGKRGFVKRLVVNTPLRCSGIARVLKGSHSFTCTPR